MTFFSVIISSCIKEKKLQRCSKMSAKIFIGFDVDETLIFTDHNKDKKGLYRYINVIKFNERMVQLLETLRQECKENLFILTSRANSCRDQLISLFKIENVFCVNDDFKDIDDMNSFFDQRKGIFDESVKRKIQKLNELRKNCNGLIYFDDMHWHDLYEQLNAQNIGIQVVKPI